ncbi:hypothetical protein CYMTET_28889 [Cymbomonas tetramitiformis]|uniref:Uncharacterized protein n=1 Tax=Cymbomonas tetramitiformis TaxID=36881 RepID=A0AAE0FMC9_9CHLO|nr:hypothetical protein CYMTET_28889 [Cymbomonas tetramitiformis]
MRLDGHSSAKVVPTDLASEAAPEAATHVVHDEVPAENGKAPEAAVHVVHDEVPAENGKAPEAAAHVVHDEVPAENGKAPSPPKLMALKTLERSPGGHVPEVRELPLPPELDAMLPPRFGEFATRFIPGAFEPPLGFGERVTGKDALWWSFWWMLRAKRRNTILLFFLIILQAAVEGMIPTLTTRLFDNLGRRETPLNELLYFVGFLGVCFVIITETNHRITLYTPSGGQFLPQLRRAIIRQHVELPQNLVRTSLPSS